MRPIRPIGPIPPHFFRRFPPAFQLKTPCVVRLLIVLAWLSGLSASPLRADCLPAPAGLIHWYRGDSDTRDFFGTGSPAQTNGTLAFVAAKVGPGLKFDGASGLVAPDSDTLDFDVTQSFTIETWVRIDGVFGNDSLLLDKRQPGGGLGYLLGLIGTNFGSETRKLYCVVQGGPTFDVRTAVVADGAFHHLAAVLNRASNTLAIYLDGALQQTNNVSGLGSLQNNGRLFLGQQSLDVPSTSGVALNGVLDELSIYNRALSAAEIQALFNAGSAGKCGAPSLTIFLTTTNTALVLWPSPSTGFALQQNTNLVTTNWVAVSEPIADNGTHKFIIVNPSAGKQFYRLKSP